MMKHAVLEEVAFIGQAQNQQNLFELCVLASKNVSDAYVREERRDEQCENRNYWTSSMYVNTMKACL